MKTLPDDVRPYKRTQLFTHETIPQGLLKNHRTGENVWGVIQVMEGRLEYTIRADEKHILANAKNGVIEPGVIHHVRPINQVTFFIEFYKKA